MGLRQLTSLIERSPNHDSAAAIGVEVDGNERQASVECREFAPLARLVSRRSWRGCRDYPKPLGDAGRTIPTAASVRSLDTDSCTTARAPIATQRSLTMPFDLSNLLYRGDNRDPGLIFPLGFSRRMNTWSY